MLSQGISNWQNNMPQDNKIYFQGALRTIFPEGILFGSTIQINGFQGTMSLTFEFLKEAQLSNKITALALIKEPGLAAAHEIGINLNNLLIFPKAKDALKEIKLLITAADVVAISQSALTTKLLIALSKTAKFSKSIVIVFNSTFLHNTQLLSKDIFDYQLLIKTIKWEGLGIESGFLKQRLVKITLTKDKYNRKPVSAYFWLPNSSGKFSLATNQEL